MHLAWYCVLPLVTYCTVRHTVRHTGSDVRCKLNVSKDKDDGSLMFLQFKTFTSHEFKIAVVTAWSEPRLEYS